MYRITTEIICDRCGYYGGLLWSDRVQKQRSWKKIARCGWEKRLHRGRWEHYCLGCAFYMRRHGLWELPYIYEPEPDCYMPW